MDLIVRTKHAARKIALCISSSDPAASKRARANSGSQDSKRATVKLAGTTADKITTLALQLLCVICVWGPGADVLDGPPSSPAALAGATPTPHGYRYAVKSL